jgi:aspartyl protease family protein
MLRRMLLATVASIALMSAGVGKASAASDTVPWTTTGSGWEIVFHRDNNACTMSRDYNEGTTFMVGYSRVKNGWWIGFGRDDWKDSIKENYEYDIVMVTDGTAWASTKFRGHVIPGQHGALLSMNTFNKDFLWALARANRVEFRGNDGKTFRWLALDGSQEAMTRLGECQTAQGYAQVTPPSNDNSQVSSNGPWIVPIERHGSNISMDGWLNGNTRVRFLLDTGATAVSIPRSVADAIGARQTRTVEVEYADGRTGTESVVLIKKLQVGNVYLTDIEATVGEGEVALLGKNFLDEFSSYEISNNQAQLTLRK